MTLEQVLVDPLVDSRNVYDWPVPIKVLTQRGRAIG